MARKSPKSILSSRMSFSRRWLRPSGKRRCFMGLVNVRNTVRAHLFRERFEVFGAVLIPFLFMAESGYANSWVFAGGRLGLDLHSLMAVGRGVALELVIYVCFRLVRGFL